MSKVYTKIEYRWTPNGVELLSSESFDYSGPVALCDRAAQNAAKQNAATAGQTGAQAGQSAQAAGSTLTPFYKQEMTAEHAFDPTQTNELLNAAGAVDAGTGASAMGEANSEAARTRNTSGFSAALDQNARDRQQALSKANLGVASADVTGAKAENQAGAAGMQGLYSTDTDAQLKAMGIQNEDVNTQIKAGQSGWLQNTMGMVSAILGNGGVGGIKGIGK